MEPVIVYQLKLEHKLYKLGITKNLGERLSSIRQHYPRLIVSNAVAVSSLSIAKKAETLLLEGVDERYEGVTPNGGSTEMYHTKIINTKFMEAVNGH